MWLTLVFGALAIGSSSKYAIDPSRRYVPLTASLGLLTVLSGGFGFVAGVIKSLQGLPHMQPDERWIWMIGLSESMVNVAFALALVALATVAMVIGSYRLARD